MAFYSKRYQDNDIFNLRNSSAEPSNKASESKLSDSKRNISNEVKFLLCGQNEKICPSTKKKNTVYSKRISTQENQGGSLLPEREMVCNTCINRELAKSKDRSRPVSTEPSQGASIRDLQERMNMVQKKRIESKINDRNNLSEMAGWSIPGTPREKDKLVNLAATKTFFLYEKKTDPLKERTMEKYKQKEMMISKSMKVCNEKPKVDEYYEKRVKNHEKENPFACYYNPKIPPKTKYLVDLDSQIKNKQIEKEQRKKIDIKTANELIEKENELIKKESFDNALYKKKIINEFSTYNRNLMTMKQKKQEQMKAQNLKEDKARTKNYEDQQEKKRQEEREKELRNKRILMKTLNLQVNEKKKNTEIEKTKDRLTDTNNTEQNSCKCNGACTVCKKAYRKEYLNPKEMFKKILTKQIPN